MTDLLAAWGRFFISYPPLRPVRGGRAVHTLSFWT